VQPHRAHPNLLSRHDLEGNRFRAPAAPPFPHHGPEEVVMGWSVESWQRFWSAPSAEVARARIPTVVVPEVTATWPRSARQVRGAEEYAGRVVTLLRLVPDLRLDLAEQAREGDVVFLRWVARGTGPDGPFTGIGTDRIRLRDGLVTDNLIMSDMPIFEHLARATGG
jgi:hypothetical protein